jgi:hypothetical protein
MKRTNKEITSPTRKKVHTSDPENWLFCVWGFSWMEAKPVVFFVWEVFAVKNPFCFTWVLKVKGTLTVKCTHRFVEHAGLSIFIFSFRAVYKSITEWVICDTSISSQWVCRRTSKSIGPIIRRRAFCVFRDGSQEVKKSLLRWSSVLRFCETIDDVWRKRNNEIRDWYCWQGLSCWNVLQIWHIHWGETYTSGKIPQIKE